MCTLLYLVHVLFKSARVGKAATLLTFAGLLVHSAGFIARWIESYQAGMGHLPIRGPYECLTFSACMVVLFYLAIELKIKSKTFGIFIMPVAFLIMVYATMSTRITKQILPMPEVLQGNYINYHLSSCFIGYAAFAVSFVASIVFLFKSGDNSTAHLSRSTLDDINYKMIAIGFVMYSILIVTGMLRSKIIWGSYWQWDQVQTWSLIAWLVYAVLLHGRFTWKWSGTLTAILSIIGFGFSIISFLVGAGFLFSSGHFPIRG
jgi:ABC-type transport system involved in cytochrome c biogenesis permease subunit